MKIIANEDGIATRQDLQHRQPDATTSRSRELAQMMLELALDLPRIPQTARSKSSWSRPPPARYYGKGYQDVQNRVPKIANTVRRPASGSRRSTMDDALKHIFDAYRSQVAEATAAGEGRSASTAVRRLHRSLACRSHRVLALKIDVDTCAARAKACPGLSKLLRRTGPARRSCSASGPITPAARSSARFGPASCRKSRARRSSSTTAC